MTRVDHGFFVLHGLSAVLRQSTATLFNAINNRWFWSELIERIGANRAAYATVMFPVVAFVLSSIFEGYEWQVVGRLVLVLLGNVLLLGPKRR